jgi:hypothetical protein
VLSQILANQGLRQYARVHQPHRAIKCLHAEADENYRATVLTVILGVKQRVQTTL